MDISNLQDKLSRGMGLAARKLGLPTCVYRPSGLLEPLGEHRRVIKFSAAFEPEGRMINNKGITSPIWQGLFDTFYTRQGDYLVTPTETFFIGTQTPRMAAQCILTNRVISLSRATFPMQGGYSGFSDSESQSILSRWPSSLTELSANSSGQRSVGQGFGTWTMLLPVLPTAPHVADIIADDLGATYLVEAAEQGVLGWRLVIRQIGA